MKIKQSFFRQLLLSGLALSFFLLSAHTTLAKNGYVSVIKDGTTIRATPSDKGEVRGEVFAGFPLQIINNKGEWSEVVDFEGDKGWVSNTLISPKKSVIVKGKNISLHEAPNSDKDNPVVVIARYGVTFTPLESRGEWLKVRYEDGTEGWVSIEQIWPTKPFESAVTKPTSSASDKHKKHSPAPTVKKTAAKVKKHKEHR